MTRPLVSAALLSIALATMAPPGQGSGSEAVLDLTETVPAGQFRAYRVQLLEPAPIEFGGEYRGVTTQQPVLPILAVVDQVTGGHGAGAIFAYDFNMFAKPYAAYVVARTPTPLGNQAMGQYNIQGGGWFTSVNFPAGLYDLVAASAPGSGNAVLRLRVLGSAQVVSADGGSSFWARGLDASTTAYDAHLWVKPGLYARAWGYSGAEFALPVSGKLYGYLGYHSPSEAHWLSPDGAPGSEFVVGGASGAWKAVFPEEEWQGPACLPRLGCDITGFGDTREDPPFALGADVRL